MGRIKDYSFYIWLKLLPTQNNYYNYVLFKSYDKHKDNTNTKYTKENENGKACLQKNKNKK